MSKIIGDKKTLDYIKEARPGNRAVYVNMDAIRNLPDMYEAVISAIQFDPKKLDEYFDEVGGGNWLPKTAMMYKIAEAAGFSGGERVISEPLVEMVDFNMMTIAGFDIPPQMVEMTVGHRVVKYGEVLQADGTIRRSSPHSSEYNVYERCCDLWSDEESATDGYSPTIVKEGEYTYYEKKKTGKYILNANGYAQPLKYDTKFKRRSHFYSEMKFAQSKADTKAWTKCIRDMAGMLTGYREEELSSGVFIFSRIRRSSDSLKFEQAARLQAMSRGLISEGDAAEALFGKKSPEPEKAEDIKADYDQPAEEESDYALMYRLVDTYLQRGLVPKGIEGMANGLLGWMKANEDSADITQESNWVEAVKVLEQIESALSDEKKIEHRQL